MKARFVFLAGICSALTTVALDAASAPVIFQSGPGRFEVAAVDATAARTVTTAADEAWRLLREPLGLPEGFSTPILVRLVPAAEWREPVPFRAFVEPGSLVSLRIGWSETLPRDTIRHGIVQALLLRLAVMQHGATDRVTAPRWLEYACTGWWQTHASAAQLDALKQSSRLLAPAVLAELLAWKRGEPESPERTASAVWLLAFLQAETTGAGEWPALLRRLLGGGEPLAAFSAAFPGRFTDASGRELWWQTGYHHARRERALPMLGARESRGELERVCRFVVAEEGGDRVITLAEASAHRGEPWMHAELEHRRSELNRNLPALHAFYRNAGMSLAEVFAGERAGAQTALPRFETDWRDALELERVTSTALDAREKK